MIITKQIPPLGVVFAPFALIIISFAFFAAFALRLFFSFVSSASLAVRLFCSIAAFAHFAVKLYISHASGSSHRYNFNYSRRAAPE